MVGGYPLDLYQGIQIYVSQSGEFSAEVGEIEVEDKDISELKRKIDAQIKANLAFKPIEVIYTYGDVKGRLTSVDRSSVGGYAGLQVWFSYLAKGRGDETFWKRGKESFNDYSNNPKYAHATPENLAVLAEIEEYGRQIAALHDKIVATRKKYGGFVTKADLGIQERKER